MRFASLFPRRHELGKRSRASLCALGWGALLSLGCFFELGELVLPGVGGSGGSGGTDAGPAGAGGAPLAGSSGSSGSGGGGTGGELCPPGTKDCGAGCVAFAVENGCANPVCTACAQVPGATLSCNTDSGACQVEACQPGFADCDGDTGSYTGEVAGNGCEYSFGPGGELRQPPALLEVPRAEIDISEGGRDDWAGVPAYPLVDTCDNCFDDALPDVIAKNEVPPRRDLDAYFRVAWDNDFLYVLGDVFDNQLFHDGQSLNDGRCQSGGVLCEDAFTIFIDGHNNRLAESSYGNDDLRVFVSLGNQAFRVSAAPIQPGQVDLKATAHAPACYRLEARLSWSYIVAVPNGQTLAGLFPPAEGFEYGFDISINDWDLSVAEGTPQRESQIFWVSPGDQYQRLTSGFGPMRLVDVASPPPSPPQ